MSSGSGLEAWKSGQIRLLDMNSETLTQGKLKLKERFPSS